MRIDIGSAQSSRRDVDLSAPGTLKLEVATVGSTPGERMHPPHMMTTINRLILLVMMLCAGACAKSDEVRQLRQQITSLNEELSKTKNDEKVIQHLARTELYRPLHSTAHGAFTPLRSTPRSTPLVGTTATPPEGGHTQPSNSRSAERSPPSRELF